MELSLSLSPGGARAGRPRVRGALHAPGCGRCGGDRSASESHPRGEALLLTSDPAPFLGPHSSLFAGGPPAMGRDPGPRGGGEYVVSEAHCGARVGPCDSSSLQAWQHEQITAHVCVILRSARTQVFARTTPQQKLLIVEQLQRRLEVVAVTGQALVCSCQRWSFRPES